MKTVIEMAREAGLFTHKEVQPELERFAELVRADERESLKELNWTAIMRKGELVTWGDAEELGDRVVAVIRARGQA